jgi:acetolactate synthase-1/3 small subunit
MTIVIDSDQTSAARVEQNLYKLVNVLRVEDLANVPSVMRDLALIKVKADARTRPEILQLAEVFRARVLDAGTTALILEVTGDESKIEALMKVLHPFGIVEMVRTGTVAMARGERAADSAATEEWISGDPKPSDPDSGSGISHSV